MVRNERQRERQQQRKLERLEANTCTVPPGRSILEQVIEKLDHALECYFHAKADKEKNLCRGEVRGLARAVAIIENPYQPNVRRVELEAATRVRAKQRAEERSTPEAEVRPPAEEGDGEGSVR